MAHIHETKQNKTLQATFAEETSCPNISETVYNTFLVLPLIFDDTVTNKKVIFSAVMYKYNSTDFVNQDSTFV